MAKAAKYIVVLAIVLAAVCAAAGMAASRRYGAAGYEASVVAAAVNWLAGSLALATVALCRNQPWGLQSVLLAIAVRMALPLAALALFSRSEHRLAAAGVAGLIVVHYLVGLVVETVLSVRLVASSQADARSSQGSAGAPRPETGRLA